MITAIIGVGNLGSALARHLVTGDELVVLAAKDEGHAVSLAHELGPHAEAAALIEEAVAGADVVVLAMWLDQIKDLVPDIAHLLERKIVVDPSNPLGFDENGQMFRTLPDDQSSASIVSALLPTSAHYVKAFGTISADSLASSAKREPNPVALFYATDDDIAAGTIEQLIRAAGFDPVRAGGVDAALRLEAPGGDLTQGGLNGELLDLEQAREILASTEVTA